MTEFNKARRVGFIGLGNIGLPMALNLCSAQFDLEVFDIDPAATAAARAHGAHAAPSLAALARRSELIAVCVRDDADVRAVMLGADGVVQSAAAGTAVAIHSTVRPQTVEEIAAAARAYDIAVIDAPVTGGADGARNRSLAYMVGGEARVIERFRPMFESSGRRIVAAGSLGSGMLLKLCNNLMAYLELIAAAEGTRLARMAGLSLDRLLELTAENGVMTPLMRQFIGNRQRASEVAGAEGVRQAFAQFAAIAEKDLDCALGAAQDRGADLPATRMARALIRGAYLSD